MGCHILLVDDEIEVIELYLKYLKRHGFTDVAVAKNSQLAVDYIEKNKPNLVFLDISLGDDSRENGVELLQRIRRQAPETKVCMMSAYRDEYEKQAMEIGAFAFITKPFRPDMLQKVAAEASK